MSGYVVCQACGTRIKAGREFCLKCFAPLPDPQAVQPTSRTVSLGLSASQQAMLAIAGVLVVGALLAVIWQTRPEKLDDSARPAARQGGPAATATAAAAPAPSTPPVQDLAGPRIAPFEPSPTAPTTQAKTESVDQAALEASRAAYDQELLKRPDDADVLNRKGQVLERLGRVDEAAASFERAARLAPDTRSYHFNLARTANLLGQTDRAIAEYREVVRLQPDDYAARYTLAMALQKQGDDRSAIPEFEHAAAVAPGDPAVHLSLGVSLERLGRVSDAVREYQRFMAIQPGAPDAQRLKDHLAALSPRP